MRFKDLLSDTKRVVLFRPNHLRHFRRNKVTFQKALLISSQYEGIYPGQEQTMADYAAYIKENSIKKEHIHTSGHAFIEDLRRFVETVKPKRIIPIHTQHPDEFQKLFAGNTVRESRDGEVIEF